MTAPLSVSPASSPYRRDIDGLRAVAVLLVVWFHAFPQTLRGGFIGVDVFFVISGYLISGIVFRQCAQGQFSLGHFYAQRVRRIFPALLPMLWACLIAGWCLMLTGEYEWLAKHVLSGAAFVQNIVLQQEAGYFDVASHLKPLLHLWSLAIEEQFYLLYPVLVWLAWRGGQRWVAAVVALAFLASFVANLHGVRHDMVRTFFWPHTRVWELLAGALLAAAQLGMLGNAAWFQRVGNGIPAALRQTLRPASALIGLGLIVLAAIRLTENHPFPGERALAPVFGAVLLIASGPDTWVHRWLLGNRLMVGVGLISYPLYLWHWPALAFVALLQGGESSAIWQVWAVLLAVVLSILTFRCVEQPLRHGRHRRAALVGLIVAMLLTVGFAGWVVQRQGVPERFPLTATSQAQFDRWEWNEQAECFRRYPQLQGLRYCNVAGEGEPRIALLGDSHANHYFPGLAAQGVPVINVGHNGCLAFGSVNTWSPAPAPQGTVCSHTFMDRALAFALEQPSIDTIVFTSRYQQYYDTASLARLYEGDTLPPNTQGNPKVFAHALRLALDQVQAKGKRAVVLLDSPDPLLDPKRCMHDKPAWRMTDHVVDPCEVERASVDKRHSGYRQTIDEVLRDYPQVLRIDPFPWFCDAEHCRVEQDGAFLFRDLDHLSLTGSEWAGRFLGEALRAPAAGQASRK